MPKNAYNKKYYPQYSGGPAYLISGFQVSKILEGIDSYNGYILNMEDLFLTGIIAERVGIRRYSSNLIQPNCWHKCYVNRLAIMTICKSVHQFKQRWNELKNSQKLC